MTTGQERDGRRPAARVVLDLPTADGGVVRMDPDTGVRQLASRMLRDVASTPGRIRRRQDLVRDVMAAALQVFLHEVAAGDRPADWSALPRTWTLASYGQDRVQPDRLYVALPAYHPFWEEGRRTQIQEVAARLVWDTIHGASPPGSPGQQAMQDLMTGCNPFWRARTLTRAAQTAYLTELVQILMAFDDRGDYALHGFAITEPLTMGDVIRGLCAVCLEVEPLTETRTLSLGIDALCKALEQPCPPDQTSVEHLRAVLGARRTGGKASPSDVLQKLHPQIQKGLFQTALTLLTLYRPLGSAHERLHERACRTLVHGPILMPRLIRVAPTTP